MELNKEYRHQTYDRREEEYEDEYGSSSQYRRDDFEQKSFNPQTTRYSTKKQEKEASVFDICLGNKEEKALAKAVLGKQLQQGYAFLKNTIPGFFTPFNSKKEFGFVAAAPLGLPVAFALVTAGSAIIASLATVTTLGSLVFAAGYGLDGLRKESSKEKAANTLALAAVAGIVAACAAAVTVAAFILTAVAAPVALAYLLTRSVTTVASKASECLSSCRSKEENPEYVSMKF